MIEAIENFLTNGVGPHLSVLICSMIPIIELRGAIPLGIGLGLNPWLTLLLAITGNMIPVPFILLLIKKFVGWCARSKVRFLQKFGEFLIRKAEKNRNKIERFGFWGVALFVAIPLPVTGAWTGSLVSAFIDLKFWKAVLSCLCGLIVAGFIVLGITVGISALFS
ncbi:MAG: small multi-drug export protein [Clostridia bacterium]|nr:small multi-drug export protein [Clostridia bacterium]